MQKDDGLVVPELLSHVGTTKQGYTLYRRPEPHGGWSYWSDEIQPVVCVYNDRLSNPVSMFDALDHMGVGKGTWEYIGKLFGYME